MKKNLSIQLKAIFLLMVFALNTIAGFACAIGIDMGFNTAHHHEEDAAITHTGSYHHTEADNDHHTSKDGNDNCCNGKVMTISQADKSLPPYSNAILSPLFLTAFISAYYNIDVPGVSKAAPNIKYFVRSTHPTISDIRIAIQSFQI